MFLFFYFFYFLAKKTKQKHTHKKHVGCCLFVVFVFRVKCENHSGIDFSIHGSRRCCSLPQLNTLLFNCYIKLCTDKRIPSGDRIDCVFLTFFFSFFSPRFCLFVCCCWGGRGIFFPFHQYPSTWAAPHRLRRLCLQLLKGGCFMH